MKNIKISAFHISESINLKEIKSNFKSELISSSSTDLFYQTDNNGFIYVFNYGVICFANFSDIDMSKAILYFMEFCNLLNYNKIDEKFEIIEDKNNEILITNSAINIPEISEDVIKVVMFNLAQSVALDYYAKTSEILFDEVKKYSGNLEEFGKLKLGRKSVIKFIGKSLNIKSRIIDNLYIFEIPDLVWDDVYLDRINSKMRKFFDLQNRYREIEFTFKNIEDNLNVFLELNQHNESKMLEWIIIVLIFIEILNMILEKL
jgi:uncharacterized Rmd1/YagE family protein